MMSWAIGLTQYDISYEPRQAIKAQALADFVAEMMHPGPSILGAWVVHVDGSSNEKGSGARVIIKNDDGIAVEYSLRFAFWTSNNQAEYEACLARIRMAKELGASVITIRSDSQLMVSQIKGDYMANEPILQKYLAKVKESL
jgi:ribonuclease HI